MTPIGAIQIMILTGSTTKKNIHRKPAAPASAIAAPKASEIAFLVCERLSFCIS